MTLSAFDLTCHRGGTRLFDPVQFDLPPGTARLLRGPNGVGKTTLLRAIAGLGAGAEGTVTLDGAPLADQEGVVAYTGHLDAVKPALTVAENLGFWAALSGVGAVEQALQAFNLTGLRDRVAGRLSAGQKRRLGLARLALSGARVWLLDEPTVSLDQDSTAALGRIISAHLETGGYALIATHLPIPIEAAPLPLTPAKPEVAHAAADPFLADGFT
ncbi:MAG: heme ABC exporter ATP-binding protein CcmA [Pseudomonadota bacterium]